MKKYIIVLVVCFLTIAIVSMADATIYYVDRARPDDSGDGTTWATAKKTIAAGVSLLRSGDTLKIASGTYPEAINVVNKNYTSWVTIETDDKNGNPGFVTLTGSATNNGHSGAIAVWNSNYVRIDGRQWDGFYCNVTGLSHAAYNLGGSDNYNYAVLKYIKATGSYTDEGVIVIGSHSNAEIAYCNVNASAPFLVQMFSWGVGDPNPRNKGSIHHNVIQGTTDSGYSGIDVLRFDYCDVYCNYLYNITGSGDGTTAIRTRQGHDNRFFNNVVYCQSGKRFKNFGQCRGMSDGSGYCRRNWWYNNTFIIEGTLTEGVFHISDVSDQNKFFNNLVIGNVTEYFFTTWTANGINNEAYSNVITGSLNGWFEKSSVEAMFTIKSAGSANQGTSFINLTGYKPFPFWGLSSSKDGAPVPSLTTDYNGNSRGDPPDVGAFEYGELPPTPAPPKNLRIIN